MIQKTRNFALSVLAAAGFLLPAMVQAADAPPPLADMWLITPKAGHGAEFRKALGEHLAFRAEHGDPRAWEVYTPLLGEDLNRYAIRYCCFHWADQDSYRAWRSEASEVNEHFQKNVMPHTEKAAHYFEALDWGNSHWVDAGEPYRFYAVTEYNLKPEHAMAFDQARDKMSQIALEQGWATDNHPWVWSSTIGGKTQEAVIIPHMNFASLDRSEDSFLNFLSSQLGSEEAAKLVQQFASASWSSEFQIWEFQEDLSMSADD